MDVRSELIWGGTLLLVALFTVSGFEYIDYLGCEGKITNMDEVEKLFGYFCLPVIAYVAYKSFHASSKNKK